MTSDVPKNDTKAVVSEGKYERRKQEDLTRDHGSHQTDERACAETGGHKVRIDTGSAHNIQVVTIAVDVDLQNRRDTTASLNERLRRLRRK